MFFPSAMIVKTKKISRGKNMGSSKSISIEGPKEVFDDVRQAVQDSAPILLGLVPFGLTCGVMGLTGGLSPGEIILMSVLVFAGAAQFIAITMVGSNIALWGIILTTLLINLRYLLMGASLAPFTLRQSFAKQALLSFLLTDESYALTIARTAQRGNSFPYHLGVSLAIYIVWIVSTVIGVVVGNYIPDPLAWGLDFAMPATFMVLLFPVLKTGSVSWSVRLPHNGRFGRLLPARKWYIIISCLLATILEAS